MYSFEWLNFENTALMFAFFPLLSVHDMVNVYESLCLLMAWNKKVKNVG